MEKRAFHKIVKKAAHNAWLLRKAAEARDLRVKAAVKTAAAAALRKQDLKGAILASVNGEKVAAPGGGAKLVGKFFDRWADRGLRSAVGQTGRYIARRAGKAFGRSGNLLSEKGTLGFLNHALGAQVGEGAFRGYNRGRGFIDRLTGNNLRRFLNEMAVEPSAKRELLRRGSEALKTPLVREGGEALAKHDTNLLKEVLKNPFYPVSAGVRQDALARTAARLKNQMRRARMQAGAAAGAVGLGSYALSDGPDYDPYRYG